MDEGEARYSLCVAYSSLAACPGATVRSQPVQHHSWAKQWPMHPPDDECRRWPWPLRPGAACYSRPGSHCLSCSKFLIVSFNGGTMEVGFSSVSGRNSFIWIGGIRKQLVATHANLCSLIVFLSLYKSFHGLCY